MIVNFLFLFNFKFMCCFKN